MNKIDIQFIESLPKDIEKKMTDELIEYETNHGIVCGYKRYSIVLQNVDQTIGVLNYYVAFAEIYVDDIWIEQKHRGRGYGRKLLDALENNFEGEGFNNINLVTSAFQAPEFYQKCGFTKEFVRENIQNPKLTKTFFIKYFANSLQTQGILRASILPG